ncbi:MAG: hypothetical protein MMC23_010071 [Stictis urceolatum]|nr:hypothetical protein [Stictis urceolata]
MGVALLAKGVKTSGKSFAALFKQSISNGMANNSLSPTQGLGLVNAIIANVPQAVLTFVYLFYNNLFTCMAAEKEFASYAVKCKGLRVTNKKGHQRSTYFLSLPFRYGAPVMAGPALLHWLMAQSIFFTEIQVFDYWGKLDEKQSTNSVSWSAAGLTLLLIVGGLLVFAPVILGERTGKSLAPLHTMIAGISGKPALVEEVYLVRLARGSNSEF